MTTALQFHTDGSRTAEELKNEQLRHAQAAHLLAAGYSPREVAEALEVDVNSVRRWLKVPWFQEKVNGLLNERGGDIITLFKGAAYDAFVALHELATSSPSKEVPASTIRAAAADILDRAYGKPKQFVETTHVKPSDDAVAEVERLQESVAERFKALGMSPSEINPSGEARA